MSAAADVVDLLSHPAADSTCRAVWASRLSGEDDLPEHRIIHSRIARLHEPTTLRRVGLRRVARGYMKCGSRPIPDWITALRVHAWDGVAWQTVRERVDLPEPAADETRWIDLENVSTSAVILEARRCGTDGGWTGWNLLEQALVLEADAPRGAAEVIDQSFTTESIDLNGLPRGVEATVLPGEVRYRTRSLEVGFRLGRAGFAYLDVDDEGTGRTNRNLLKLSSLFGHINGVGVAALRDLMTQGVRLRPVGGKPAIGFLDQAARGTTRVRGNVITYEMEIPGAGQRYTLRWEVLEDRLVLTARRDGERPLRAWDSSAWQISLNSAVIPTASLGRITREGEAGLMPLPILLHAPGHGTLRVETDQPNGVSWRSDSWRPANTTTTELKLGETPTSLGDYILEPGRHEATVSFTVVRHEIPVRSDAPPAVRRGLDRCLLTSVTYRPDTATLTNNSNSIHSIICADCWSATSTHIGEILPGLDAVDLMRDTLERWLDGGPGYANGSFRDGDSMRYAEDEYIMTGTAALLGLADYLRAAGDPRWVARHAGAIAGEIDRMRGRDLDGDGIVESPHRLGVSGRHHWSTSWYDVISFGWKDAFSNALLYPALIALDAELPRLGGSNIAAGLRDWAARLKTNYLPTFLNRDTGWLAGWRCQEDRLHDYGFLFVNGAAINGGLVDDPSLALDIVRRLYGEMSKLPTIDFRLGLPGALRPIPYDDVAIPMPHGVYMNMTLNHSQARHFLGAMYRVGMTREADAILEKLMESLGDGSAFGGCGSGVDWRRGDGAPAGYEGLLSDQFGVLAIAMERYGIDREGKTR